MKKLITTLLTLIISFSSISIALADDRLVPTRNPVDQTPEGQGSFIGVIQQLPDGEWTTILAGVIQFILAITGSLALVSFTVGGVIMITAQGKDEQIGKGKGIIMWSVLALIIIAVSYAIVLGISNLVLV